MFLKTKLDNFGLALLMPINHAAVVFLGIYTTVWGIWVASPFWSVFSRAPLYSILEGLPPEWAWGLLAIVCGLVIIYGAMKASTKSLLLGASVGGWHWLMIGIFYFIGDWQSTGGITALTFALYASYVYLNTKINAKKAINNS